MFVKKNFFILFFFLFIFSMNNAFADSIILSNGDVIKGKIEFVLSNLVHIKTDDGIKSVYREVSPEKARDIIEVQAFDGRFSRKILSANKLSGNVYYMDDEILELITPSGKIKLKRYKIKEITLFDQTPNGL